MRMRWILIIAYCCICLACRFDGDADYYPITQKSFLLGEDPSSHMPEVLLIKDNTFIQDWDQNWSELNGSLSDMAGQDDLLWLCSGEGERILEIDAEAEQITRILETPNVSPHFICSGTTYLFLSDTIENQVAFVNRRTESLIILATDSMPGEAHYVAPYFFVVVGKQNVAIYHEDALTEIASFDVGQALIGLEYDHVQNLLCLSQAHPDSQVYRSDIDINTLQIISIQTLGSLDIRFSPYTTVLYGKEWPFLVRFLADGIVAPAAFDTVKSLEMDFFESRYYYVSRDSLHTYQIRSRVRKNLGPYSGRLNKAYFYIAPIGG